MQPIILLQKIGKLFVDETIAVSKPIRLSTAIKDIFALKTACKN